MAERRPVVLVGTKVQELPAGDTIAGASSQAGEFDGGSATTTYSGIAAIDAGGAT